MGTKYTRLSLEQEGRRITYEVLYEDVSGETMMDGIYTILLGMGFPPETVLRLFIQFIELNGSEQYVICKKNDSYE